MNKKRRQRKFILKRIHVQKKCYVIKPLDSSHRDLSSIGESFFTILASLAYTVSNTVSDGATKMVVNDYSPKWG